METIEGRGKAPALVLRYIDRLPDTSLTFALEMGGRDHFGWGLDRHMFASLYDLLALNTEASGRWKNKPPELERWKRPDVPEEDEATPTKKRTTVKDIFARFKQLS